MDNSLPNSYLFSQYNDYGLDEKKIIVISFTNHSQQLASF